MLPEQRLNLERFLEWLKTRDELFLSQVSYGRSGRHWFATRLRVLTGISVDGPEKWDINDPFAIGYYHSHTGLVGAAKNLKTVLIIRDPRDCFISELYHHVYIWKKGTGNKWPDEETFISLMQVGQPLLKSKITKWLSYFKDYIPHNTIVIQYERFCLYPEEVFTRVCDFLELPMLKDPNKVIADVDNTRASVDKDGIHFEPKHYGTGEERYYDHCLKWQKDRKLEYLHHHMWETMGDVMLQWGYTKQGHAKNLLVK